MKYFNRPEQIIDDGTVEAFVGEVVNNIGIRESAGRPKHSFSFLVSE